MTHQRAVETVANVLCLLALLGFALFLLAAWWLL